MISKKYVQNKQTNITLKCLHALKGEGMQIYVITKYHMSLRYCQTKLILFFPFICMKDEHCICMKDENISLGWQSQILGGDSRIRIDISWVHFQCFLISRSKLLVSFFFRTITIALTILHKCKYSYGRHWFCMFLDILYYIKLVM